MPNLRNNSTVMTYNDDAIYKSMEKQRREMKEVSKYSVKSSSSVMEEDDDNIPDMVYSEDGRCFYPCLYCCHAFAIKKDQLQHMQQCNFKTVSGVPERIVQQPRKPAFNKSPNLAIKREVKDVFGNNTHVVSQVKKRIESASKGEIVQKSSLNALMENSALTVIKKSPTTKVSFPKIKFKFPPKIPKNMKSKVGVQQTEIDHTVVEDSTGNNHNNRASKLYFTKEELKQYHELYRQTDMSKCTICYKAIAKSCWYRHLKTHCIDKKYTCGVCQKKFGRKDHRDIHQRTHTNQFLNNS